MPNGRCRKFKRALPAASHLTRDVFEEAVYEKLTASHVVIPPSAG